MVNYFSLYVHYNSDCPSAGEAPEKYNDPDKRLGSSSVTEQPAVMSSNPLDKLDFSSREFRAGVDGLADKLQVRRIAIY